MSITITRNTVPARTIVTLRGTIPTYSDEGQLWGRFIPLLERQGIRPTGPGGAIEHDEEFKEAQVDESVWLPVAPGTTADDPLVVVDLAETEVVRAVVVGPYSQITDPHSRIADFVAEHGLTLAQRGSDDVATKVFNTHLNDPSSTKPEELVTEVNVPIC